ncbi:MAG: hypothetical protein A2X85_00145 [Geobacteraceae bacterium GWF2_54_21]|nr:MAG: hypothetical protein A2X85_00145 [Geobacteraceae bacterium GWF2_54_21]
MGLSAVLILITAAFAAVPQTINYQGYLKGSSGAPVNSATNMVFSLYSTTSGVRPVWGSGTVSITPVNGIYSVELGKSPQPVLGIAFNRSYWLGVKAGTDPEMRPLQPLTSVPYALHAVEAEMVPDGSVTSTKLADGSITAAKLDTAYVKKAGDTMTGALILPANALVAGTNQLVTSSGNVGIGTATPAAKLSVSTTSGFFGDYIASGSWGVMRLMEGPTIRAYLGYGDPGGFLLNSVPDSSGFYAVTGGLHLTANVDATKGITVTPTGNIGIGTTAPSYKMHVIETTPSNDSPGVYGEHAVTDNYGVGVTGKGGWKGVSGIVAGTGGGGYIGVQGNATTSNSAGSTYGGYFTASGGANNYGIYASSSKHYLQGNVGLGTTAPGARLHLKGAGFPDSFIYLDTTGAGQDSGLRFYENGAVKSHLYWSSPTQNLKLYGNGASGLDVAATGNVGIGTGTPAEKLHVWGNYLRVEGGGSERAYIGGDGAGGDVQIGSMNAGITNVAMYNTATNTYMSVYLKNVHVMGGADLAEPFNSVDANKLEPGMVVTIDAENPGQLVLAEAAYDKKVAGIVSGANGISAGMTMSQEGTPASGSVPVALTGRVYAWADASYGAITPGDLLTTSDTPGHAMKVTDHGRAQGAIIGKAMSKLSEGKGLVLVLVTLQ